MQAIIGLGNPGNLYCDTRHNIGFTVIDVLQKLLHLKNEQKKFDGLLSSNGQYLLFKPCRFMNLSGLPVMKLLQFYKIPLENVVVIHDDLDLALNKIKIKKGGGSGGHNGIKSIDQAIGSEYYRMRIGIGKPLYDVSGYVLNKFSSDEIIILQYFFDYLIKNYTQFLDKKYEQFINNYYNLK